MGVEKILGIAGFKSIPVVYYSLTGNDFHDHKRYFQHVFYLDSKMKIEIDWLSDRTQFIAKGFCNRDPVHLEQQRILIVVKQTILCW